MIRLTDALKAVGPAATFLLLVALSCVLLILGRVEPAAIERLRATMIDSTTPVLATLARPIDLARQVADAVDSHLDLQAENARLKASVERLEAWQAVARHLADENKSLRALASLPADPQTTYVTARVVADSGGPFVRTVLINAGARDGVQRGQAIATGDGVVGRIVGLGERAARVLLLTDLNSRVPVVIQGTRFRAVMVGDNGPHPKLDYLPSAAAVTPGDRVVTSGDGGMFPAGLPVGVITSVEGRVPRVQLLADFEKLDFVRVLRFAVPLDIEDRGPSVIAPPTAPAPQAVTPSANPAPTPTPSTPTPSTPGASITVPGLSARSSAPHAGTAPTPAGTPQLGAPQAGAPQGAGPAKPGEAQAPAAPAEEGGEAPDAADRSE